MNNTDNSQTLGLPKNYNEIILNKYYEKCLNLNDNVDCVIQLRAQLVDVTEELVVY